MFLLIRGKVRRGFFVGQPRGRAIVEMDEPGNKTRAVNLRPDRKISCELGIRNRIIKKSFIMQIENIYTL